MKPRTHLIVWVVCLALSVLILPALVSIIFFQSWTLLATLSPGEEPPLSAKLVIFVPFIILVAYVLGLIVFWPPNLWPRKSAPAG